MSSRFVLVGLQYSDTVYVLHHHHHFSILLQFVKDNNN